MTAKLIANNCEDVNYRFSLAVARTYTVGICEEPDTGDDSESNMVPAKWSLIDLREGHTPSLIWIRDVCLRILVTDVRCCSLTYIYTGNIAICSITDAPK